ncbi:1,4-dihydroxy-2-naphthoate octaprenyltransferase [Candidatus Amoebophilus asiaticus]|nr:1,4-dihydroxy-2-naphthoate octaprenyltransferase [Candidatus Amoebophilus asiaticus]
MPSIKTWVIVVRLPTIILSISSIIMGTALAVWSGKWDISVGILAGITASLLQIIANLANDYGDFLHGAGVGARVNNTQAVSQGSVNLKQIRVAIFCLVGLTIVCGIILLHLADLPKNTFIQFILLGVIAIIAAITYTMGPKPYAYIGLGDVSLFIFFGLVGVLGTAYLHTKIWNTAYLLPALTCGCFSVAVLNLNNIRDIDEDAPIGKKTLVVRIGRKAALYYQWALLVMGILGAIIFTAQHYHRPIQWIFLAALPQLVQSGMLTMRLPVNQLDPLLQRLVMAQLSFVLLFSIGLVLSCDC